MEPHRSDSALFTDSPEMSELPSVENVNDYEAPATQTAATGSNGNGSQTSESTRLTSSDKLTELPPISSSSNAWNRSHIGASASYPSSELAPSGPGSQQNLAASLPHTSVSEGSIVKGRRSPKQRVSFESDRASFPTLRNVRQAFSRTTRISDPTSPSPVNRTSEDQRNLHGLNADSLDSPGSRSQSRTTSPRRIFHWPNSHRPHSREDPFIPVDPFQSRPRFCDFRRDQERQYGDIELGRAFEPEYYDADMCCCLLYSPCTSSIKPSSRMRAYFSVIQNFILDTVPRQAYLHLLLRLPSLYWSRVARVFEDAEVSKPDVERMIHAYCSPPQDARSPERNTTAQAVAMSSSTAALYGGRTTTILPFPDEWNTPAVSPALVRFKISWEEFIDSLMREWKTLNVVSALLLSAIVSLFQIPQAVDDPIIRTAALLSLVCALMSLSYGCIYYIRFGSMRSMYKASRWAEEARKQNTLIWWNVWVLLSMPGVWLAWSMMLFVISILSFVWRTGAPSDPPDPVALTNGAALGTRIAITAVFALGLVYWASILNTLKRYGEGVSKKDREAGRRMGLGAGPASEIVRDEIEREARRGRDGIAVDEKDHGQEQMTIRGRRGDGRRKLAEIPPLQVIEQGPSTETNGTDNEKEDITTTVVLASNQRSDE